MILVKDKLGDFKDLHAQTQEQNTSNDVVTDESKGKEFKNVEQLANYYKEQDSKSEEQLKKEARARNDVPITHRDTNREKLFLLQQVGLLAPSDRTRAIQLFFKLKIVHEMSNKRIAEQFKEPVEVIDILERTGIEMVKEAIANQKGIVW